jgi:hypothetical protein
VEKGIEKEYRKKECREKKYGEEKCGEKCERKSVKRV